MSTPVQVVYKLNVDPGFWVPMAVKQATTRVVASAALSGLKKFTGDEPLFCVMTASTTRGAKFALIGLFWNFGLSLWGINNRPGFLERLHALDQSTWPCEMLSPAPNQSPANPQDLNQPNQTKPNQTDLTKPNQTKPDPNPNPKTPGPPKSRFSSSCQSPDIRITNITAESPSTLAKLRSGGVGRELTESEADEDRKRVYMLRMALL